MLVLTIRQGFFVRAFHALLLNDPRSLELPRDFRACSTTLPYFRFRQGSERLTVPRPIGYSVDLVRDMAACHEIPHVPKGNGEKRVHVLIDRLDLDRWVEKKKVGAAA